MTDFHLTYFAFHLLFIVPPIAVLGMVGRRHIRGSKPGFIALIGAIAFLYTTPWDNYLVYRGIWSYGADRVVSTIGYVPIEEYLFFVLQPVLTGLFLLLVQHRLPTQDSPSNAIPIRRFGALAGIGITIIGVAGLMNDETLYGGLILVWAGPVLAGQCFLAGERLLNGACLTAVFVPTIYLWIADRVAIADGIWALSPRYTLGWDVLGLPVEEALFFLLTNVMIVQGLVMFQGASRRSR